MPREGVPESVASQVEQNLLKLGRLCVDDLRDSFIDLYQKFYMSPLSPKTKDAIHFLS